MPWPAMDARILVPARYAAWLAGDLGHRLQSTLETDLRKRMGIAVRVTRLPRGFLVEAPETPGVLLEAVCACVGKLERHVAKQYPIFHREMGPLWTGTLQSLFPQEAAVP